MPAAQSMMSQYDDERSEDQPQHCSEETLLNSLVIMLEEAGSRGRQQDAIRVVSGVLTDLSEEYDQLTDAAKAWASQLDSSTDGGPADG